MRTIDLKQLRATIAARKAALGWDTPEWTERLRNPGTTRLPAKRDMLARIQERAQAAGMTPQKASF